MRSSLREGFRGSWNLVDILSVRYSDYYFFLWSSLYPEHYTSIIVCKSNCLCLSPLIACAFLKANIVFFFNSVYLVPSTMLGI